MILDGAMGTELERRGVPVELPLWSAYAVRERPDAVLQIHIEYLQAGANVITANTFRTNRRTLAKSGVENLFPGLAERAIGLAREAISVAGDAKTKLAGSVAPLEDCYKPELSPREKGYDEFAELSEALIEAGSDFLLIETMNNTAELRAAIRAARTVGAPFWMSVCPDEAGERLLGGEPMAEAIAIANGEGARVLLANCGTMDAIERAVELIADKSSVPFGGYANVYESKVSPAEFAEHGARLADSGATIVGGCCGTTPEHIQALAETLVKSPA